MCNTCETAGEVGYQVPRYRSCYYLLPSEEGATLSGAAAELIAQQRKLPFILFSGHADAEHVVLDHEPITVRLPKPISLANLEDAIHRAMTLGSPVRKSQME